MKTNNKKNISIIIAVILWIIIATAYNTGHTDLAISGIATITIYNYYRIQLMEK